MKCRYCNETSEGTFPVPSSGGYLSDCRAKDGQAHVTQELCLRHALKLGYGPPIKASQLQPGDPVYFDEDEQAFMPFPAGALSGVPKGYTMGVDWDSPGGPTPEYHEHIQELGQVFERLRQQAEQMDEAVVTATQSMEGLREALPPDELTPSELVEATLIEDHIEEALEKHPGKGWMPIAVIDSDPNADPYDDGLCRVGRYIRGRFYGWDIRYVPGDPMWEFKAR